LGSEPDISDIHPKLENPIRRDNPKKYTFLSMFESVYFIQEETAVIKVNKIKKNVMNSSIIHEINPSYFAVALKRQKGLKKHLDY
jgi:hypothetical protein